MCVCVCVCVMGCRCVKDPDGNTLHPLHMHPVDGIIRLAVLLVNIVVNEEVSIFVNCMIRIL